MLLLFAESQNILYRCKPLILLGLWAHTLLLTDKLGIIHLVSGDVNHLYSRTDITQKRFVSMNIYKERLEFPDVLRTGRIVLAKLTVF